MSAAAHSDPLRIAAAVFDHAQQARYQLMALGTLTGLPVNKKAVLLSQMLSRMNDAVKDDFSRIMMGGLPRYDVVLRDKATGELVPLV